MSALGADHRHEADVATLHPVPEFAEAEPIHPDVGSGEQLQDSSRRHARTMRWVPGVVAIALHGRPDPLVAGDIGADDDDKPNSMHTGELNGPLGWPSPLKKATSTVAASRS